MADRFPTTQWHLVLMAGQGVADQSADALATLCRVYWYPIYAFVRRQGYGVDEAQDLTQGFFTRLLERHFLNDCRQERGRFRSFLLASLKHFLANERDWVRAQKRGGGVPIVSLDDAIRLGESRYSAEPRHDITPETVFERQWARSLLEHVLTRLQSEFTEAGKAGQFERLKAFLTGDDSRIPYRRLSEDLAMSEGALKVAVHRLRRRFREVLRYEISQTVAHPDEVREEIRYLMSVIGR